MITSRQISDYMMITDDQCTFLVWLIVPVTREVRDRRHAIRPLIMHEVQCRLVGLAAGLIKVAGVQFRTGSTLRDMTARIYPHLVLNLSLGCTFGRRVTAL